MADHYVWGMYKFDITSLAGETVDLAEFSWYLDIHTLGVDQGVGLWRAGSANDTDDQDWTTADGIAKLYDNICEYSRDNVVRSDRLVFTPSSTIGYYVWDLTSAMQDAINDGDDFFTCVLSRDVTQDVGTKIKAGAAATTGLISRGGSVQGTTWRTSETTVNPPFLEVTLPILSVYIPPFRRRRRV